MDELERLQARGIEVFRTNRPAKPPLMFLAGPLTLWIDARLIEILREGSFPEARPAFNPVFIHLPADGCRLTELAARAGMTKQAMGELVDELVELGYLKRFPDPKDRRAKIIVRSEKGLKRHGDTLAAFAQIDAELTEIIGPERMEDLRGLLAPLAERVRQT